MPPICRRCVWSHRAAARGIGKGSERFIAVTSATVTPSPSDSSEPLGLVIVNRSAVRMVTVIRG
jgi:hypothetical protein